MRVSFCYFHNNDKMKGRDRFENLSLLKADRPSGLSLRDNTGAKTTVNVRIECGDELVGGWRICSALEQRVAATL